jgi:hypothetical protein
VQTVSAIDSPVTAGFYRRRVGAGKGDMLLGRPYALGLVVGGGRERSMERATLPGDARFSEKAVGLPNKLLKLRGVLTPGALGKVFAYRARLQSTLLVCRRGVSSLSALAL